jgi:methionyl-tRNA formyltransferase
MSRLERLAFFGTPAFAVPTLDALAAASRLPLVVVTQPPRPAGRGRDVQEPPVALWARARGIELLQPERVRRPEVLDDMAARDLDLALVVAFGQIFPKRLLALPRHGCINLHASLLPKYRGASPVAAAIAAGETTTGVTTVVMEEELDSGPILLQREVEIGEEETTGELEARLSTLGAGLVVETLDRLENGTLEPVPQPGEATFAPLLDKKDGVVDWSLTAPELFNRLRAFTPWPGMQARLRGQSLKLVWARPLLGVESLEPGPPGEILGLGASDLLEVRCGAGTVLGLERVQRPGRKVVTARDLKNGERIEIGERFGAGVPAGV